MQRIAASSARVIRAGERNQTRLDWLHGQHSFDTGVHPFGRDTNHGLLVVHNEDVIAPGTGFDTHPHQDMEIVTWVLQGALVHQDSEGHSGVIYPNLAQRMSAGRGILHSEKNDRRRIGAMSGEDEPVRLIQMWVVPDEQRAEPSYEKLELPPAELVGRFATVASGMPRHHGSAAIRIGNQFAAFHVARLAPGQTVELMTAPFLHVFVARGAVEIEGVGHIGTGDVVRLTAAGGNRVRAADDAEVLVWEMHATLT